MQQVWFKVFGFWYTIITGSSLKLLSCVLLRVGQPLTGTIETTGPFGHKLSSGLPREWVDAGRTPLDSHSQQHTTFAVFCPPKRAAGHLRFNVREIDSNFC